MQTWTSSPLPRLPWNTFSISIAYYKLPPNALVRATAKEAEDPNPELNGTSDSTSISEGFIGRIFKILPIDEFSYPGL